MLLERTHFLAAIPVALMLAGSAAGCSDGAMSEESQAVDERRGDERDYPSTFEFQSFDGPWTWSEQQKLVAANRSDTDEFGEVMALSADVVLVGAPRDNTRANGSGAAVIFARDEGGEDNWGRVTELFASDATWDAEFGSAVSVSSEVALVGAPFARYDGARKGSAYLFGRNVEGPDAWGRITRLNAADAADGDRFGAAVAVSDELAVVGAHAKNVSGSWSGAAYVFARDEGGGDNWGQVAKLTAPDGAADDTFGRAVAVSGDVVAVGAHGHDERGSDAGAAYVFSRDHGGPNNWGLVTKLVPSELEADDDFATAVALSGDLLVVGARGDDDRASGAGAAYVFARNEGGTDNWGQVVKLTASDGEAFDWLGQTVAVSNTVAWIGAMRDDEALAYAFAQNQGGPGNWGEVEVVSAVDQQPGLGAEGAVAVSGEFGAISNSGSDGQLGAAYVFGVPNAPPEAADDALSVDEDTPTAIDVLANDVDSNGDPLVIEQITEPSHGTVVDDEGEITYTPEPEYNGDDSFDYTISDGRGETSTATVSVTVVAVNDPPVAADDTATLDQGTALSIRVLANDTDIDSDSLVVDSVASPTHGTASHDGDSVLYTPEADYAGDDSFDYTVADADGATATATVHVTVMAVEDGPHDGDADAGADTGADADAGGANQSSGQSNAGKGGCSTVHAPANLAAVLLVLLGVWGLRRRRSLVAVLLVAVGLAASGCSDASAPDDSPEPTTVQAQRLDGRWADPTELAAGGVVAMSGGVAIVGDRGAAPNGVNSGAAYVFARDEGGEGNWGQVKTLLPNDPEDYDEFGHSVAMGGDVALITARHDDDGTGAAYLFAKDEGGPNNWGLVDKLSAPDASYWRFARHVAVNADTAILTAMKMDNSKVALIFAKDPSGANAWRYVKDLDLGGVAQFYMLTMSEDNAVAIIDPPGIADDHVHLFGRAQGGPDNWGRIKQLDVQYGDSAAVSGDVVAVGSSSSPTPNGNGSGTGQVYLFAKDHGGPDQWRQFKTLFAKDAVRLDAFGASVALRGDMLVVGAPGDDVHTDQIYENSGSAYVFVRDHGGADNWGQVAKLGAAERATGAGFGSDITLDDHSIVVGGTPAHAFDIPNSSPEAAADAASTAEDTPVTIDVLANDTDVDLDALSVHAVTQPAHGSAVSNGADLTYTPGADFNGEDTFEYTVSDGSGGHATATVTVTVSPVNDAPVAADDTAQTDVDTPVTIEVLVNDATVDGDTLTIESTTRPTHGQIGHDGYAITYNPAGDHIGEDSFAYTITDGQGQTATATVRVIVLPVEELTGTPGADAGTDSGQPDNSSSEGKAANGGCSSVDAPANAAVALVVLLGLLGFRLRRRALTMALGVIALVTIGCGGGGESPSQAVVQCEPDPARIAERDRCQTDETCPCGTFCDLGRCEAECTSDADCADGEVCSTYGQCRSPDQVDQWRLPATQGGGSLSFVASSRTLPDGQALRVELRAGEEPVSRARVEGVDGALVLCPDAQVWTAECMLTEIDAQAIVELYVKRRTAGDGDQEVDPDAIATLEAHTSEGTDRLSLFRPQQRLAPMPDVAPAPDAPIAGRYEGQMRLSGVGSDRDLDALSAPSERLDQPVTATVWSVDDRFVISIADELNALTSRPAFVGEATLGEADADTGVRAGQVAFPMHPFIETTVAGRTTAWLTSTVDARVHVTSRPRTVELELTQSFLGSGADVAPTVRWRVDLERVADADQAAPSVPADATFGDDPAAQLAAASPWEAAFGQTVNATIDPDAALRWYNGGPASLAMCGSQEGSNAVAEALFAKWLSLDGRNLTEPIREDTPFYALIDNVYWGTSAPSFDDASFEPELSDARLPCELTDLNLQVSTQNDGGGAASFSHIDFCEEVAAKTGCVLEDASSETLEVTADGTFLRSGEEKTITADYSMKVVRTCRLPAVGSSCSEGIFCMDPAPDAGDADYVAGEFDLDPQALAESGDFSCASGRRTATIALDAVDPGERTVGEAINGCLDEVLTLADAPPTMSPEPYGAGFDALYDDPACVGVGRLLTAVAAQSRSLRADVPMPESDRHAAGVAYTHRLLSRWLQVHSFIATESDQLADMKNVFSTDEDDGGEDVESQRFVDGAQARQAMVQGWDLILSPHITHAVLNTPRAVLESPDYRAHKSGYETAEHEEQKQPLSAVMLETLARQSIYLNKEVRTSLSVTDEERVALLRGFTPRSIMVQALAADMHARAGAGQPQPQVESDYDRAWRRLLATSTTTAQTLAGFASGLDPLGIADRNLPLYFHTSTITGAIGRFTAVSDFIAGSGPGDDAAWAPAMVDDAKASLEAARQAFLDQADRDLQAERYERDVQVWASQIRREYNAKLRDYCGPLDDSPVDDPDFDASTCSIDQQNPDCQFDVKGWYERWTDEDVMARFCMHHKIDQSSLDDSLGFASQKLRDFARRCPRTDSANAQAVSIGACAGDPQTPCLKCTANPALDEVPLDGTSLQLRGRNGGNGETGYFGAWNTYWSECEARFSGARRNILLPKSPIERPECVSGALGEAFLGVASANFDVQQANQQMADHIEAYDIAMQSCWTLAESNQRLKNVRDAHRTTMRNLNILRSTADSTASALGATKDCLGAAASADKDDPLSAVVNGGIVSGLCVTAGFESAAEIISINLQSEMERNQMRHDDTVANLEAEAEEKICFNEARLKLVGAKTAAIDLERAAFDLEGAQGSYATMVAEAQSAHARGHAFLEESDLFDTPAPVGTPWFDELVSTYTRDFKLARRATYLAVRAVEYEFQQSIGLRQQVLQAQVPTDLEAVLQELWQDSGTRSIQGSRPTELSTVLSLRDDILQLGDKSQWPAEMRPMTPQQRFQVLLTSERYAAYDERGQYTGQRIPFSLAPLAALGMDAKGVPIYSQNDCAERLWSVNASMVGDDLFRGSDTSFVRIDLLKRNTFYSQWCGDAPEGQPFQLATVRPTQNLFREPGVGEEYGTDQGVEQSAERFSRARIQAFFGVDRAALEDTQYANGETSELAARGLYGDYALFIPASLIARDDEDGLVLENVDDILLRLDYLSVAKP
ncbi:tandem-95 repeat protein [Persicimonas caeni]|uniref:Tandem-95 repeat protein n=1 Tax=Persicimonas caeni TaxID=2292766 RepID=A0A4Y6PWD0_PERCE|nr:tandem-95 repeat protein [Persicimonas caeni]QDG52045.1 tandem-95 repeat protein [Persicimonas caeni]QED33266.1 tandem-95 repeat protein [Persicimonas caeni]